MAESFTMARKANIDKMEQYYGIEDISIIHGGKHALITSSGRTDPLGIGVAITSQGKREVRGIGVGYANGGTGVHHTNRIHERRKTPIGHHQAE